MRFFRPALHLLLAASLAGFLAGSLALWGLGAARAGDGPGRIAPAIAMQGEPALPADFACLPYADPHARKGGTLRLGAIRDLRESQSLWRQRRRFGGGARRPGL